MKLSTHPESTVALRFTRYCLVVMKSFTLYSTKYKKKRVSNILQISCKTSLKKKGKKKSIASANAWIGTHATFPVIPKRCCRFSVVQSFQFEFATHPTYRANIRDQLIENTTIVSVDVILSV